MSRTASPVMSNVDNDHDLMSKLYDVNTQAEKHMDNANNKIREAKELYNKLTEMNENTLVTGNNNMDLENLKKLVRNNSITRSRISRIYIEELSKLRNIERECDKFKDKIALLVDGGNAEQRKAFSNGYVVVLEDFIAKYKTLLETLVSIIRDIDAMKDSIITQKNIMKDELGINNVTEEF